MTDCLLICRSITYAQRAQRILERKGIKASVVRPNLNLTGGECGHAVGLSEVFLAESLDVLKQYGLTPQKILIADSYHRYREMPL